MICVDVMSRDLVVTYYFITLLWYIKNTIYYLYIGKSPETRDNNSNLSFFDKTSPSLKLPA